MSRNLRYKDIRLLQLRSFCVAATEQNFTTAALALNLSVPTVWEQVRALERRFGAPLLSRQGRAVALTPAGQLLLELVQPCVSGLDSLEQLFSARLADLPQSCTVLSTPYLLSYHLVKPIQEFTRQYPSINLTLQSDVLSHESQRRLEQGKAEIVIVPYHREEPHSPFLEYEDLLELKFMLLTATAHPLVRKRRIRMSDLTQYPFIGQNRESYASQAVERLLQRCNLTKQLRVVVESAMTEVLCKYVAAGVGIALIYATEQDSRAHPGIHMRIFDRQMDTLPVALVIRKGAHLSEAARRFRETVRLHLALGAPRSRD